MLLVLVLAMLAIGSWRSGKTADRAEVRQAVMDLRPSCRPIMQTRFRARVMVEGRPLTRREMAEVAGSIRDCDRIEDQLQGLVGQ